MGKGARKRQRTASWQRVTALLPLALLSAGLSASATSDEDRSTVSAPRLPNPGMPSVPAEAFQQPASVGLPEGSSLPGMPAGLAPESVFRIDTQAAPSSSGAVTPNGIPVSALRAYQRAAALLNDADPSCNLDWTLIAAIGRVESDHGRDSGNILDEAGKAQPGIYGAPLNGSSGTAQVLDTDGGAFDNDAVYDRAVGPMQFVPHTWSLAGVDADQDGRQDPQDIDDAAAAAAVYLCSGTDDLSTEAGQRAAVYRYNHSPSYVDLVLSIAASYAGGEYNVVPNGSMSTTALVPPSTSRPERTVRKPSSDDTRSRDPRGGTAPASGSRAGNSGGAGGGSGTGGSDSRSGGAGGGADGGSGGSDGGGGSGNGGSGGRDPAPSPADPRPVEKTTDKARETVEDVTTPLEEAQQYCQRIDRGQASFSQCVDAYLRGGAGAVRNLLDGLVGGGTGIG